MKSAICWLKRRLVVGSPYGVDGPMKLVKSPDQSERGAPTGVAVGVADQHVAAGAAVDEVLPRRVRVDEVVEPVVRGQLVVEVAEVVAPAEEADVTAGAADDPVVLEVAEDHVVAVRRDAGVRRADDPLRVDQALVVV